MMNLELPWGSIDFLGRADEVTEYLTFCEPNVAPARVRSWHKRDARKRSGNVS
jgi:hypothetical protein